MPSTWPDPAARAAYLADVCPAIERGAVSLAACKDPSNHLQCPANEDDNQPLTQGLQLAAQAIDPIVRPKKP